MIEVSVTQRLGSFTLDAEFAADSRFIALFGPSGSGKTSLINVIAGLDAARARARRHRRRGAYRYGARRVLARRISGGSAWCFRKGACSRI